MRVGCHGGFGERVRLVGRKFECVEFMKQLLAWGAVPKLV